MALGTERTEYRDGHSEVALRIKASALEVFYSIEKVGLEKAMRQRDMGDEKALDK